MPAEHLHYFTTGLAVRPESSFGRGSVEIGPPKPGSGEGGVRRLAITAHELVEQPHPTVRNIPDFIAYAVRTYGSGYVGWRDVVKIHEEVLEVKKKSWLGTVACIAYASGSTGPKGVSITHGNLIASVSSVCLVFGSHVPRGNIYLSYPPLAHVLEYIVELCTLFVSVT